MREFMRSLRTSWQSARFGAGYEIVEGSARFYWWRVVVNLVALWWPILYQKALRVLNLGERRCAWCQKLMGWRRGLHATSHGICRKCNAKWNADLEADAQKASALLKREQRREQRRNRRRNTPLRSTLRRRTGGWSGAVALRGRVS